MNLGFLIRLQPASYALAIEVFDALDGEEISCNDKDHPEQVSSRQVNEAKGLTERNPGQHESNAEHEQSADDNGRGCAAFQQGHPLGAHDMHDKKLGCQADDEPTSLKESLVDGRIRAESKPQYGKGQEIENGTDRSKNEHKSGNRFGRPRLWMGAEAFIYAIPGKKNLGDVVEEILHEELDGSHGQERKEEARHEYAENVAEIRAEGDFDVFEDVAGGGAALVDTGEQRFEVFPEHDDLGAFTSQVGTSIDDNAHIGFAQGIGVISTVAKKADAMAFGS